MDIALANSSIDWDLPLRWTGWVRRPPRDLGDADQVILEVEEIFGIPAACGAVQATAGRLPEQPPLELDYGERVEWLGPPRRIRNLGNPGMFDRVGWLERQGVYLAASVKARVPWKKLPGSGGSRIEAGLWRLRQALRARLDALSASQGRTGSDAEAALQAMLLGDRRDLSPELKSSFQRSGAYHVLVVSGLHVGLLAGGVFWMLRLAGLRREWGALAGLAAAVGYAMLLEGAVPTGRAAWMLAFYTGGLLLYRGRRPLNIIAAVALGFYCSTRTCWPTPASNSPFWRWGSSPESAFPFWTGPRSLGGWRCSTPGTRTSTCTCPPTPPSAGCWRDCGSSPWSR